MEQSETIAKLSEALAKAQGSMTGAVKDSANPFFKSKYADLSSVWEACRKPLSDNGLSVVQTSEFLPEHPDMVCIVTSLNHSSGEWIRGRLAVKPVKTDPQSVGSCITYLRRYSLQSMVGIAPEDDDGNAASGTVKPKVTPDRYEEPPLTFIDDKQKSQIMDYIDSKQIDTAKFLKYMACESIETIPAEAFNKAISSLQAAKGKQ